MESGSLLKNLVVFVPALNRYSAGRPCVCEMYRICKTWQVKHAPEKVLRQEHQGSARRIGFFTVIIIIIIILLF